MTGDPTLRSVLARALDPIDAYLWRVEGQHLFTSPENLADTMLLDPALAAAERVLAAAAVVADLYRGLNVGKNTEILDLMLAVDDYRSAVEAR